MATRKPKSACRRVAECCRRLVLIWSLMGALTVPGWVIAEEPAVEHAAGLFAVYERNRQEGVPELHH